MNGQPRQYVYNHSNCQCDECQQAGDWFVEDCEGMYIICDESQVEIVDGRPTFAG